MISFAKMSYRNKLMLMVTSVAGMALMMMCATILVSDYSEAKKELYLHLATSMEIIGANVVPALEFNDPQAAEDDLRMLEVEKDIIGSWLYTSDGNLFASYQSEAFPKECLHAADVECKECRVNIITLDRPVFSNGEQLGSIRIKHDLKPLHDSIRKKFRTIAMVMIAAIGMAFLLASRFQRGLSAPVLHLAATAEKISRDRDYSIRARKFNDDELGALTDSLNEMLEQIELRDVALSQAKDELEGRVEERTLDLKGAKEKAEEALVTLGEKNDSIRLQKEIAAAANESIDPHEVLQKALDLFCRYSQWEVGHVYLLATDGEKRVDPSYLWHLEDPEKFENFRRVTDRTSFAIGSGIPGRVLESKKPEWVINIMGKGEFPRAQMGYELGVCSGFGMPVLLGDEVVAVLEFYSSRQIQPDQELLDNCEQIGAQVGRVFERRQAADILRDQEGRIREILSVTDDSFVTINECGIIQSYNRAAERIFGHKTEDVLGKNIALLMPSEHAEKHNGYIERYIETGEVKVIGIEREVMGLHKDGSEFPLLIRVAETTYKGQRLFVGCAQDITEKKLAEIERERLQQELLESSRYAGMAEIATGVLHNVGNVLNSVNVGAMMVKDKVKASGVSNIIKLAELLHEHEDNLGEFITTDTKGKAVPEYLATLGGHLIDEQSMILDELSILTKNIEHIKDIVSTQQSYAKVSGVMESLRLENLFEDALRINMASIERHHIEIIREYEAIGEIESERHQVIQILVNLINNSKNALVEKNLGNRKMTLRICTCEDDRDSIQLDVIDNGIGIEKENLNRVFSHGFTTRKDGHGFGLHSCALAARQLGGSLIAKSEGHGCGATFTVKLPVKIAEMQS